MPLIALEVVLGVVPLGWGVWELISLRRERRRDAEAATGASAVPADPDPPASREATRD